MRSYTNKDGEIVEVGKEHLDTAVKIKRELQMASPSYRCNWKKHKEMMEKEGFFDSEASENYRLMIKNYQASIDELPSKEKYADLVSTSKLKSIKEAVGEMAYTKRSVQLESQKLGKLKRELTLYGVVAEQVYEALINELDMNIPDLSTMGRLPSNSKRMIVVLSDWHIGAVVINVNGNSYNYSIAKDRVGLFLQKITKIAVDNGINDIDIVCLGDMTEHVSMRKVNQAFETEFPVTEQTVKAFELIRNLIVNLAQSFNVTYRGVSGNHDRINGDKSDNIDGDSTVYLINYMVKLFGEASKEKIPRFKYVEVDDINYSTTMELFGVNIKFVHGDNEPKSGILSSHSILDSVSYNLIVMGHLHHYHVREVGQNKFEAWFGSLMGINNYGKKGKFGSTASQGIIIVDESGEIDIRRIGLQTA